MRLRNLVQPLELLLNSQSSSGEASDLNLRPLVSIWSAFQTQVRTSRYVAEVPRSEERTFSEACAMSAIPAKADIRWASRHVRFVPKADIRLFDHLVGAGKQRLRNAEAKFPRSLEV